MSTLNLSDSSCGYVGLFNEPPFQLWKRKNIEIVEDAYKLFRGFDVDLSDIRFSSDGENFYEDSLTVNFEDNCQFTLTPAGIECEIEGFSNGNGEFFFTLLSLVDDWLRSSADDLSYSSHSIEYGGHGFLDEGTAQDYLQAFQQRQLKSVPQNLASGLVFNWIDPGSGGKSHIEIDHSFDLPEGMFLRWLMTFHKDRIKHEKIGRYYISTLFKVLAELNLTLAGAL